MVSNWTVFINRSCREGENESAGLLGVRFPSLTELIIRVLHRSPQDWSTYQGFLRDASESLDDRLRAAYLPAQLCVALEGHHQASQSSKTNIDWVLITVVARQLYSNATAEKLRLLHVLQEHENLRRKEESSIRAYLEDRIQASDRVCPSNS